MFCFFLKSFRSLFHYYGEPEGREGEKGYGWGGGEGGVGGDGGEHLLPLPLFPLWLSHSASRLLWHDWKATSQPPSPTSVPPLTLTGYFSGWATRCVLTPTWWLSTGGLAIRFSCRTRWTAGENNLAKACHAKEIKVDQISIIISRSAADETKPYLASVFRLKSADGQFLKRNLKSEMSLFQPQPGNGKEGRWMPGKIKTVSLLSSLSLTSWLSSLSLSSWLSSLSSWFLWCHNQHQSGDDKMPREPDQLLFNNSRTEGKAVVCPELQITKVFIVFRSFYKSLLIELGRLSSS